MEQVQRDLVKEQEWAKAAEVRVGDGWGKTALAQVQQVTVFAQAAGRRPPTN
jgi:hypothetical protein